jgi:hypothetical protein
VVRSIWCLLVRATLVALRAVWARNVRVEADSIVSTRQDAAIETDVESCHLPWTGASRR